MKILWLSEGNNIYDKCFIERLLERGHELIFVSYTLDKVINVDGIEPIHRKYSFFGQETQLAKKLKFRRIRTRLIIRHLRKIIKKYRPDILHSGYIRFHGYYGVLSGFHPHLSMPWGSDVLIRSDLSEYDREMVNHTLQNADAITCDCELVKRKIMEVSGCREDKITIFPWGVDLKIFHPVEGPSQLRTKMDLQDNKVLIMNRKFDPIYGIEYFIDALPEIISKVPDVRVLLVGYGYMESVLRSKVKNAGLSNYVKFVGAVEHSSMGEYLNASDIYVTASLSDGTSASMLEAMACKLPVVVSDAPANYEWIKDGVHGYIVPRKNSKILAERIVKLLDSPELRKEMGQRNLQIAQERANWERNMDILEGIYERLVSKC